MFVCQSVLFNVVFTCFLHIFLRVIWHIPHLACQPISGTNVGTWRAVNGFQSSSHEDVRITYSSAKFFHHMANVRVPFSTIHSSDWGRRCLFEQMDMSSRNSTKHVRGGQRDERGGFRSYFATRNEKAALQQRKKTGATGGKFATCMA